MAKDPITRSGSFYSTPRDSNRVPITLGVSTVDGITPVPIEVNPATGQLQTSSSGGGGSLASQSSDYWPMYNVMNLGGGNLRIDPGGALLTRGATTTDEGTFRANFYGSSSTVSPGTATFTNGSTAVTGSGFSTYDIHYGNFIKLGSDAESAWSEIGFINSDTSITLFTPYTGTGGTGAYSLSQIATSTGTGATLSVSSGQFIMALGTNAAATTYVYLPASDGPSVFQTSAALSQRIANQDIYVGIEANIAGTIKQFSRFHFTGTTNTQVITETGYNISSTPSAGETETNTVTLPNSATTATANTYRIEQEPDQTYFFVNGLVVATHTKHIPHVETEGDNVSTSDIRAVNSGSVTNTNVTLDYITSRNFDRLDTNNNNITIGQTIKANSIPVTLASDQGALTDNITQFGSNNVVTGTGAGGLGIPRVTVSSDSTVGITQGGFVASVKNLTNSNPLAVEIVDGTGNQITSFGGGTQYAEGITTSPGTGTLTLGRYSSPAPTIATGAMESLQLDSAGNLLVNVKVGGTSSSSSTVTAGDVSTIAGAPVQTTADGTQVVSLAGPTGDLIDTVGNKLEVSATQWGSWVNSNNVEVPTFFSATENASAILCKVTPGYLLTLTATNYNSTRRYFQVFNQQTLPVQGNIPLFSRPISGGSPNAPGSLELGSELFGVGGLYLNSGVAVGISTSANVFIPAAGVDHTIAGMFV